ncbi:hypothetical protein [Secundilactobacillus similis]|uniref:hypothetical protein n=1 Tax=Secundilactobacillus similis TaxID=414682 RepID=UPI0006CFEC69|nr:hypothetical protein [Secundilactobacillus similis]
MPILSYHPNESDISEAYGLDCEIYPSSLDIVKKVRIVGGDLLPANGWSEISTLEALQQWLTKKTHHVLYAGVFNSKQDLFYELGDDDFLREEIEEYGGERFMLYFCEETQQYFLLMLTYEYL